MTGPGPTTVLLELTTLTFSAAGVLGRLNSQVAVPPDRVDESPLTVTDLPIRPTAPSSPPPDVFWFTSCCRS